MTSPFRRSASATSLSRVNKGHFGWAQQVWFFCVIYNSFVIAVRSQTSQSERCVPAILWSKCRHHSPRPLFPLLTAASKGWWEVRLNNFISSWREFKSPGKLGVGQCYTHCQWCVSFQEAHPVWTDEVSYSSTTEVSCESDPRWEE